MWPPRLQGQLSHREMRHGGHKSEHVPRAEEPDLPVDSYDFVAPGSC